MLPPVRTTISSFPDYQAQPQNPMPRQRIDVTNGLANAASAAYSPFSGGRLDLLSLSAQLQLAQGVSVFAETIGKLIKLPRREGEALPDYARRLMEAVANLNPSERMALQKALNQLVNGITLRLLTEILGNPAGPDAARFAVRFETSQPLDRDLAANAVVRSYRQNAGVEQQTGTTQLSSVLAGPANPGTSGGSISNETSPGGEGQIRAEPHTPNAFAASPADEPNSGTVRVASPADNALEPSNGTDTETSAAIRGDFGVFDAADLNSMREAGMESAALPKPETASAAEAPSDEASETASITADDPMLLRFAGGQEAEATGSDRGRLPVILHDEPSVIGPPLRHLNPARSSVMDKITVPTIAEWLVEVLTRGTDGALQLLPGTDRDFSERSPLSRLLDNDVVGQSMVQSNRSAPESAREAARHMAVDPQSPPISARLAGQHPGINGEAMELDEQLLLPMSLPHLLRDGIPLPYVGYPQEERETGPEERKARAVSATDEDGDQQDSAGGQAFHEEPAKDDPKGESGADVSGPETAENDGHHSSPANDLYWRMAGWA